MMRKLTLFIYIFFNYLALQSQPSVLDDYVQQALNRNLALQQHDLSYQKSLEALKEARRMFFPTVMVEARYTRAQGGRTVEVPFGDLLNPAYSNLNLLNQALQQANPSYPQIPAYPTIDNYTLNFIREREQDTRLQVGMPVYNPDLMQNVRIKKEMSQAEGYGADAYRRELVKEVKTAYMQYLQALEINELYTQALELVNESLRARQSLYDNGKITIDEVYSAQAQVLEMQKELAEASGKSTMAAAWFNFLLNREPGEPINTEAPLVMTQPADSTEFNTIIARREESLQLQAYQSISQHRVNLEKGSVLPRLSLGAAFGYQGEDYTLTPDSDFAMVNLTLSWKIFSSGQRQARVNQARLDEQMVATQRAEFENQVAMQLLDAQTTLDIQLKTIALAGEELKNHEMAFRFVERRYAAGTANQLEYSQAINKRLESQSKLILAQYEYLIQQIKLERIMASYTIR